MKKVLQINTVCGRGSTGRIATDLLTCLKEKGYSGKIAYGVGTALGAAPEDTIKIGTSIDYYTHNVISRFSDKEGCYSLFATKRLISQIEKYAPDIIHLHNIHGHYLNYELFFSYLKESKIPVVWTFHDCWAFTGHCSHFTMAKCEQWKSRCSYCSNLHCYPVCYTIGNVGRNFDRKRQCFSGLENLTIVTPSQWLAGLVKESFLKDYPIKVINNGIDLNKFQPKTISTFRKQYNLEGKTVILAVASEWSDRKGYQDFIALSSELTEKQKLVIVGVNDKQAEALPKSVVAIKKTNSTEELAEIYSSADVFLNFTYEDNFPTVNLEAMACGTPVITYRTGGSIESITDATGAILDPGNYLGALDLIESVKHLDRKAIAEYAANYSAIDKFNDYICLYDTILTAQESSI